MFLPLHDKNPLRIIPFQVVTCAIIVVCVLVFLLQITLPAEKESAMLLSFGVLPAVLFDQRQLTPELAILPAELTLLSSMFLHGNWFHLLGNMAFLWVFGDNIEDSMGHWRFLLFYLVCGAFAGVCHALAQSESIAPMFGASGAVSALLGAYLMLHPRVKVWVLVLFRFPMRLRAYWIIGIWVLLQIYNIVYAADQTVAWWAHVGGFAMGIILIPFFKHASVPLFDRGTEH